MLFPGPAGPAGVDERGVRQPLGGVVDVAVGGGQPSSDGLYPDGTRGLTTTVHF